MIRETDTSFSYFKPAGYTHDTTKHISESKNFTRFFTNIQKFNRTTSNFSSPEQRPQKLAPVLHTLTHHILQLFFRLHNTLTIIWVNNKNQALCILEVVTPQRTNFVLTTNIPHRKANILIFYCLYIKSNGRYCRNNLAQLELIQNCSFTSSIQSNCK